MAPSLSLDWVRHYTVSGRCKHCRFAFKVDWPGARDPAAITASVRPAHDKASDCRCFEWSGFWVPFFARHSRLLVTEA